MEEFSKLPDAVGDRVTLAAGTLEMNAELTTCRRVGSGEAAALSLLFETGQTEGAPQQIFRVTGERIGELSLFLVPIGPGERGMVYEAIIDPGPAATP